MPGYKTHILGGSFLYIAALLNGFDALIYGVTTLVYCLLPDIDIANSKLGKPLRVCMISIAILLLALGKDLFSLLILLALVLLMITKHRGFVHSFRASLIFSIPLGFFSISLALFACLQFNIHLILDKCWKL